MLYVETDSSGNDVINLTVGDDATLTVPMTSSNGDEYEMSEYEYLIFNVREKPTEDSPLIIDIRSENGSNEIDITHADTADIPVGFYSAEVQLMTEDGKRITIWPKLSGNARISSANRKNFCLMTEVVRK